MGGASMSDILIGLIVGIIAGVIGVALDAQAHPPITKQALSFIR